MLRLLWLLLITAALAGGSALELGQENSYSVDGHILYFEDVSRTMPFSQIQNSPFTPSESSNINFGFTRSVYWFRIDVTRNLKVPQNRWWLVIAYPLLEKIDVYVADKRGTLVSHRQMGMLMPKTSGTFSLRDFTTDFSLKDSQATLFIRVQTESSMQVPLSIYSSEGLFHEIEKNNLRVGIYYGIFLIILMYNIVIFFYTKDLNYLRYIFFLASYILWQLSFDGTGIEYLWCDSSWSMHHGSSFWIAMSAFSALYFSRGFLHTNYYTPKMDVLIRFVMGISIIMAAASLLLSYGKVIMINAAIASLVPLILFIAGIKVMRAGYHPARFYIAGWSSLLIGTLIFAFNKFDLIPSFYGVNHIQQIGSGIEMIFLSWALADRVHLLQREYIGKLNRLNETLSEKVHDALVEARAKDRLFVQQSRLAAMGEMIEQIAHQWRQPLNTLALINQDLYVKYKLGKCGESCFEKAHGQIDEHLQYLSKTIDDFRNYYKTDKAKHPEDVGELVEDALRLSDVFLKYAKIKTAVRIMTSHKVHLAKNEMMQVLINLIKNAHDAIIEKRKEEGIIEITVQDREKFVEVSVEDNAGGISKDVIDKVFDIYFTTKDQGTGLGLHMSKYLIEESFGGTIRVENAKNGARFVILLPMTEA